jgi:hypothetical protein
MVSTELPVMPCVITIVRLKQRRWSSVSIANARSFFRTTISHAVALTANAALRILTDCPEYHV